MLRLSRQLREVCPRCRYHNALQTFAETRRRGSRRLFSTAKPRAEFLRPKYPHHGSQAREDLGRPRPLARFTAGSMRGGRSRDSVYYRHLPLNLNSIALEVSSLGRPASILRLNVDPLPKLTLPDRREEEQKGQDEAQTDNGQGAGNERLPVQSQDILQSIAEGPQNLEVGEIVAAVNSVRDDWLAGIDPQELVTEAQCYDVYQRLDKAFSDTQLRHYLEETESWSAEDYDDLQGVFETEHCVRSPWYVGPTQQAEPGSLIPKSPTTPPLRPRWLLQSHVRQVKGTNSKANGKSRKTSVIESILRRSWRLRTVEELQLSGQMDVKLDPNHAEFLRALNFFQELERRLQVQVTFNKAKDTLRISGLHEACSLAFTSIYAPLQTIQHRVLDLGSCSQLSTAWQRLIIYSPLVGKQAAETFKVHAKALKGEKNLVFDVWFLAPHQADNVGEDISAFEAFSYFMSDLVIGAALVEPLFQVRNSSGPLRTVPIDLTTSMGALLRDYSWVREQSNSPSTTLKREGVDLVTADTTKMLLFLAKDVLTGFRNIDGIATPDMPLNSSWEREFCREVTFETGFAAFETRHVQKPHDKAGSSSTTGSHRTAAPRNDLADTPRLFAPVVPGGIATSERIAEAMSSTSNQVVIRFKHDQILSREDNDKWGDVAFPDLELAFQFDASTERIQLQGAELTLCNTRQQIMLPDEAADALVISRASISTAGKAIGTQITNIDGDIRNWSSTIIAFDGHVDDRSFSKTLDIDVPLQATSARPTFYELVGKALASERKGRQLNQGVPVTAPIDSRMRPARASDLDVSQTDPEYFDTVQPYDPSQPASTTYSDAEPFLTDEELDLQFDYPEGDQVDEREPFKNRSRDRKLMNRGNDEQLDPEALFERDLAFRGVAIPRHSVRARYRFAGLEYQNHLNFTYKDCDLIYATIDSGEKGGRYERLVLKAPDTRSTAEGSHDESGRSRTNLVRERVMQRDRDLLPLLGDEEASRFVDWLETGLAMIKEIK